MTAQRMADLVALWVRLYTRNLPPPVAQRRVDEIAADLHDHIAHERSRATGDRRIALHLAGRMVRGMAADVSWRGRMLADRSTPKERMTMHRSFARVALVTALVLLVPLVSMQFSSEVNWSVADFVLAGVLLAGTGLLLELAVRKPANIAYRAAAIAIGAAAIVVGELDDAPGLVLFGGLLILGTVAMSVRTARRSE